MGAFFDKNWSHNTGPYWVIIQRLTWGAFLCENLTHNMGAFLCTNLTHNMGAFLGKI